MSAHQRLLPIAITVAATFVLSLGAFFGCAHNFMSPNTTLGAVFFWAFFVFGTACVASFIWLLAAIVLNLAREKKEM